jgi:hypothetical protein
MPPCGDNCAWLWAEKPNRVRRSWIVNRSKPVLSVAMSGGTTGGKKIHGRKRHLLVDTLGLLILVKVLAANIRDPRRGQGAAHHSGRKPPSSPPHVG